MTVTQAAVVPQTALCRAFCRYYTTLTGTGLATGRPSPAHLEKDGDND